MARTSDRTSLFDPPFLATLIVASVVLCALHPALAEEKPLTTHDSWAEEDWDLVVDANYAPRARPEVAKQWRRAVQGDYQGSLDRLKGHHEPAADVVRAFAYNGLGKYDLAISEARKALTRSEGGEPYVAEAHNQLGLALLQPVLRDIHSPADPAGAAAALVEAESSFRAAIELASEPPDGVLLNLAAVLIAQHMLDQRWRRWGELDEILGFVAELLPEHSAWAEKSLDQEPALPQLLATQVAEEIAVFDPVAAKVYEPGGNVNRPRKLSAPQPQYTEEARKARIQGVVAVEALIDEQGRVQRIRVLQSLDPGLDQSTMKAISQWRFKPATLDGEPVPIVYRLTANFRLQ